MTLPVLGVLSVLLDTAPGAERYGLEIAAECGLTTGTIYPIMQRLKEVGWVNDRWESIEDAARENRPARRYYALSDGGRAHAIHAVTRASGRRLGAARALREAPAWGAGHA